MTSFHGRNALFIVSILCFICSGKYYKQCTVAFSSVKMSRGSTINYRRTLQPTAGTRRLGNEITENNKSSKSNNTMKGSSTQKQSESKEKLKLTKNSKKRGGQTTSKRSNNDGLKQEKRKGQEINSIDQGSGEKNEKQYQDLKWILLVEDEESLRNSVGRYIAKEGQYIVTGVVDARSAMLICRGIFRPNFQGRIKQSFLSPVNQITETLDGLKDGNATSNRRIPKTPDCLILDIRLPGPMNGLELLKTIRDDPILSSLPIVLLTARGRVEDRIAGYDAGADAYLSKPFDPEELLSIIDSLLKRDRPSVPEGQKSDTEAVLFGDLMNELEEIEVLLKKLGFTNNREAIGSTKVSRNNGDSGISIESLHRELSEIKGILEEKSEQSNTGEFAARELRFANPSDDNEIAPDNIDEKEHTPSSPEDEFMHLLEKGMTSKEIAEQMRCSVDETTNTLDVLLKKANVINRTELVRWWKNNKT